MGCFVWKKQVKFPLLELNLLTEVSEARPHHIPKFRRFSKFENFSGSVNLAAVYTIQTWVQLYIMLPVRATITDSGHLA